MRNGKKIFKIFFEFVTKLKKNRTNKCFNSTVESGRLNFNVFFKEEKKLPNERKKSRKKKLAKSDVYKNNTEEKFHLSHQSEQAREK